jgi:hypothetical protein
MERNGSANGRKRCGSLQRLSGFSLILSRRSPSPGPLFAKSTRRVLFSFCCLRTGVGWERADGVANSGGWRPIGYGGSLADAGKAIGKTGDGGIDGVIKEDRLGVDLLYIQAKRWDNATVARPRPALSPARH